MLNGASSTLPFQLEVVECFLEEIIVEAYGSWQGSKYS